jgi:TorA maturation chaperone TorD
MTDTELQIVSALARATAYRTFSLAFQAPTDARLRTMGAPDAFAVLLEAFRSLDTDSTGVFAAGVDRVREARQTLEALTLEYWRVFGHTTRGLVCACETEYGDDNKFQQPNQLADISGYYLAFGLAPPSASEVRQDHVACECEFMEFLNLKEACFLEAGERTTEVEETLAATRQAQRTFLRDHLGYFGRGFASRLATDGGGRYFNAWGGLFLQFLDGECARLGVEGGSAELPVRAELGDDAPMACGSACDLIQVQRHP